MSKKETPRPPGLVFGGFLLVKMLPSVPQNLEIHCPRGRNILYGEVVSQGDGFEPGANAFREMPGLGTLVSFEENPEDVEGHYFYRDSQEFRIIHVDTVIMAFPSE